MSTNQGTGLLRRYVGFISGILLFIFLLISPTPDGLSPEGKKVAAMVLLMTCWWIGESIPIGITALVPLVFLPLMGVMGASEASAPYANHNIFLFMGGFFIAMAMQKWNLHRRIALSIVNRVGFKPRRIVLGFMVATAALSMWISNTATTLMMIPIAIAIMDHFKYEKGEVRLMAHLGPAVALGIAYSANVGGMGTLVGTPPNIIFAKVVGEIIPGYEISFLGWMIAALPFVIVFVPLMWLLLTRFLYRVPASGETGKEVIEAERAKLGPMSRGEKLVLVMFCMTALLWITRAGIHELNIPGWADLFPHAAFLKDSTVAIGMSMLMFLIPANLKRREFLLDLKWAMRIPWDIILLLGGGFSLAHAVAASGLGKWIGNTFEPLTLLPLIGVIGITCLIISLMTEIMSNTATATLFLPLLGAIAVKAGIHPLLLMIPATLAGSCAFILPSGTPPNAIVFATGNVTLPQMSRTGIIFDLLAVVLLAIMLPLIILPILGL